MSKEVTIATHAAMIPELWNATSDDLGVDRRFFLNSLIRRTKHLTPDEFTRLQASYPDRMQMANSIYREYQHTQEQWDTYTCVECRKVWKELRTERETAEGFPEEHHSCPRCDGIGYRGDPEEKD